MSDRGHRRRWLDVRHVVAFGLAMACASTGQATSIKTVVRGVVPFAIDRAELATGDSSLQEFLCRVRSTKAPTEVVVVVGHADPSEPGPAALAERRAAVVKCALVNAGFELGRIYVDSKVATQSVSLERMANARAEVEFVGTGPAKMSASWAGYSATK